MPEIESLASLDAQLATAGTLAECYVQSLDLTGRSDQLLATDVTHAVFLGCTFAPGVEPHLENGGALVFPSLPDLPFNPYRSGLYTADELYAGLGRGHRYTLDARVYRWWRYVGRHRSLTSELAMTLHDHAIADALDDLCGRIDPLHAVGIMGGHAMQRGGDDYIGAARLASQITRNGGTVMTGGGPGAMEAANLGARLAGQYTELTAAIQRLAEVPGYEPDITWWAQSALDIVASTHATGTSIGIPTWHYGHEPPNVFATQIAKYFSNALREDTLLQRCHGGLIYLPGAAGTVQEIFQAATRNYYLPEGSQPVPMVLVDVEHWTRTVPAWPLLHSLGHGRPMQTAAHLVATVDEAAAVVLARG